MIQNKIGFCINCFQTIRIFEIQSGDIINKTNNYS